MNKKQTFAVASTSVLAAGMAQGAIVYSGPISYAITGNDSYPVDLNQDSNMDYIVHFDGANGDNQLKPFVDSRNTNPNAWVLSKSNSGAPVSPFGFTNDASYMATYPTNKVGYLYQDGGGNVVGDWSSTADTEGYVGVELNDGVSTNYGWIHLIYKAQSVNTKSLVLVDYAYETASGKGIIFGATNTPAAPIIYVGPSAQTVGSGSDVTMSVTALADPPPSYQWQAGAVGSGVYTNLTDNGRFSGTTTPTLSITGATQSDTADYIVVVSNTLGKATNAPPATLNVLNLILGTPQPAQARIFAGQNPSFNIGVLSGVPTGFQWQKDGTNVQDGAKYSGTTSSNLIVNGLTSDDSGNYDVVVDSAGGPVTSANANLAVVATNGGAYEAETLADGPLDYFRLNETELPATNNVVAFDNIRGRNGIYGIDVLNGSVNYGIAGPRPADGFVGFTTDNAAITTSLNDTNALISLAPWNLYTNTVTICAWINPQAQQVSGAGVVYTRSTNNMVCGLAYHGAADTNGQYSLGYNWNDQMFAWNWTSGLKVPQNQWSFVSLVVTPTNATVYVINTNGSNFAVNTANHAPQAFNDTIIIGSDPASATGGRNFAGSIDEVSVFGYSLSRDQIYRLYARAIGQVALPPQITQQPVSQMLYAGQTSHLRVSAIGSDPLSFQWKAGSGGVYTNLDGATNSSLAIPNFSAGKVADYVVEVSNNGGSVSSTVAHVGLYAGTPGIYDSTVLALGGSSGGLAAFYPLDETTDPALGGAVAFDTAGGFNGIYGIPVMNGNANYAIAGPRPADGFIGFSPTNTAARFTTALGGQSEIVCQPLNLTTNALTITAWINPASPPQQWAGLVFCRGNGGNVGGLDFTELNGSGETCLGYHWKDSFDTYSWVSGLVPPQNQWSFVALVIDPATTNATIWMMNTNGTKSASNFTTNNLSPMTFAANTTIGNDPYDTSSGRVFDGSIDSVAIFPQALTPAQIQTLYSGAMGIAAVNIQIHQVGNQIELDWPRGTLLEADSLNGPWTTNYAVSPYLLAPEAPQKFYKVSVQ